MTINGREYKFAYTVGAYITISELKLGRPKTLADQCKVVTQMAVIMNKAYEDKCKIENPEHQVNYLTIPQVNALSINEVVEQLSPEVDAAVKLGAYRSIETVPKTEGAEDRQ